MEETRCVPISLHRSVTTRSSISLDSALKRRHYWCIATFLRCFKALQYWISIFSTCLILRLLRPGIIQPWLYLPAITSRCCITRFASQARDCRYSLEIRATRSELFPYKYIDRAAGRLTCKCESTFKTMSSRRGVRWKHANHLRWGISYSLSHEQTMAWPITRQSDLPFDLANRPALSAGISDKVAATRD